MKKGKLYLIPTTLGDFETATQVLPSYNSMLVHRLTDFIVEQVRTARRFLTALQHPVSIDEMTFYELNKHTDLSDIGNYLDATEEGRSIGLLSEAGTPCVADPGALIVAQAHQKQIEVVPLVGPNSLLLALMASGFNGQHFLFHGYLPIENNARNRKIRALEAAVYQQDQTQIFIETPYRNNKLFETLLKLLRPETKICMAVDLTLPTAFIRTKSVAQWKRQRTDLHKRPAVFLVYR